jgi:hypothetical protein
MTVAAAIRTPRRLVLVSDSRRGEYPQPGRISQMMGHKPEVTYGRPEGKFLETTVGPMHVIIAYAGDFPRESMVSIKSELADLGSKATHEAVYERLAKISKDLSIEALPGRRPPAQFLTGIATFRELRLARIDIEVEEARPNSVVSIGGLSPWDEQPMSEDPSIDAHKRGPRNAVLKLVKDYIKSNESPSYGLPLYWITATLAGEVRRGWYPREP